MGNWGTCRYCGDKIIWAQMPAGNWLPIDADFGGIHECVTFNRSPACPDRSPSRSSDLPPGYAYHSSMRELAQDLGYSIIFPTYCRFCGRLIYLFATPDGGFAIFDKLGKPWAKHVCHNIRPATRQYHSYDLTPSDRYRLPVPEQTEERKASESQELTGTIVSATDDGRVKLYDGLYLYQLTISPPLLDVGICVSGVVVIRSDTAVFEVLERYELTTQDVLNSEKAACEKETGTDALARNNEIIRLIGRLGKRIKQIWGVFSNSHRLVATFAYRYRNEADAHAAKLTAERQSIFYVQPLKCFMANPKD